VHRYIGLFGIAAIVLLAGLGTQPGKALSETKRETGNADFAPDRILVKAKEGASTNAVGTVNRKNKARTKKKIPRNRLSVVELPGDLPVEEAVERYEASPDIEYAEPDYKVRPAQSLPTPNDPRYREIYSLDNIGQNGGTVDADVDAPEAWGVTPGSADTIVAVIDTGIDTNHPDIRNNIWVNPGESGTDGSGNSKATNGVDDDANGYVDDVNGWDFFNNDNSVFDTADDDRHGTHVAGTLAAEGNNSIGITGINWKAKIMPAKFIGPGDIGYVSDVIEALNYAVANGATISNNSWALSYSRALLDTIKATDTKGHLLVTAAMNHGSDNDSSPHYPASYDSPNIISVAATDNKDSLASFSNYGASSVDLAAPGVSVLSTVPGNGYSYGSGTSMATPHVAGAAALVKANFPNLDDSGIKERILSSVDPKPNLAGKTVTGGRLNVAKTLGANTAPVIDHPSPSRTRDRTPTISATVRDDDANLTESNISLYVDGVQKTTFAYDQDADKLTYTSTRLSRKSHKVEVIVQDGQGHTATKTWWFRIQR
jgi:thermitase